MLDVSVSTVSLCRLITAVHVGRTRRHDTRQAGHDAVCEQSPLHKGPSLPAPTTNHHPSAFPIFTKAPQPNDQNALPNPYRHSLPPPPSPGLGRLLQRRRPWPSDHAGMLNAIQAASNVRSPPLPTKRPSITNVHVLPCPQEMQSLSPLEVGEHQYTAHVDDKCIKFILDNISGAPRDISATEASNGFGKEYRGCANGG